MEKLEILNGKQVTHDYPYGRLRCTRTTEIEYHDKKGYRVAHTTINPKNGVVNKPKRSTYSNYGFLYRNKKTGYVSYGSKNIYGLTDIKWLQEFLEVNGSQLEVTDIESQNLWAHIIAVMRATMHWITLKPEFDMFKDYIPMSNVKAMIKAYENHESIKDLVHIKFDVEALENMKS